MLTEDYCSYEVVKLLKEKGFDIPCKYAWHGGIKEPDFHRHSRNFNGGDYKDLRTKWYSAPTHQMAMKWLREEKRIAIIIEFDLTKRGFCPYVYQLDYDMDWVKNWRINIPMKYEEAIEAALRYSLKNLI